MNHVIVLFEIIKIGGQKKFEFACLDFNSVDNISELNSKLEANRKQRLIKTGMANEVNTEVNIVNFQIVISNSFFPT
jgi:hypothetical protein